MGKMMNNFSRIWKIHPLPSPQSPILSAPLCRQTVCITMPLYLWSFLTILLILKNLFFNNLLEPAFQCEMLKLWLSLFLLYFLNILVNQNIIHIGSLEISFSFLWPSFESCLWKCTIGFNFNLAFFVAYIPYQYSFYVCR